ncbi:MAG: sigma-70 family RNA polymerase sigma factor [Gammaproteobacteria bacterium]|nr:sigma-70 family RNA polymerase sigma factor [Gammaproteobacteria bacterium]
MGNAQTRFEALAGAFAADLYRFAYWLCRDRHRAEDLVQETYLRAWRALDNLREERAAKGWLLTILRREYARGHERYRPPLVDDEPDRFAAEHGCPVETLQLRRALAQLPEEYREPLLLQVLGGYSCEEIAQTLGISRAAVMTRLFRARQQLRAVLEESSSRPVSREVVR